MDVKQLIKQQAGVLILLLIMILALSVSTYAWFTNYSKVNTNSLVVRSGPEEFVFEMGNASTGQWSTDKQVSLNSDTGASQTKELYPVSSFDLTNFVECTKFDSDGNAVSFALAEDGGVYYHGWIDVRATASGEASSSISGKVQLYLLGTLVPSGAGSALLKAARVGIKLSSDDAVTALHYFPLDTTPGTHQDEHPSTSPTQGGYQEGQLLGWSNGQLVYGEDNAEDYTKFVFAEDETAQRPEKVLAELELGRTYRLDVYYYIEGTDADSANYLSASPGQLHVNLYAALDSWDDL